VAATFGSGPVPRRGLGALAALALACSPDPGAAPAVDAPTGPEARRSAAIGFSGFGPAAFGAGEAAVRAAFGPGLTGGERTPGSSCRYLIFAPAGPGTPYAIAFMIEEDRFVRVDVASSDQVAPGGGRVGMARGRLAALYAGRFRETPHKYVAGGAYFVVAPPGGSEAELVFELDAGGQVTEWRIGLAPQVHYVEGCS
jgi:hypothetical protein